MEIREAIERFKKQLDSAQCVLDSGFGTNPNESDSVYRNRKEMAEIGLLCEIKLIKLLIGEYEVIKI